MKCKFGTWFWEYHTNKNVRWCISILTSVQNFRIKARWYLVFKVIWRTLHTRITKTLSTTRFDGFLLTPLSCFGCSCSWPIWYLKNTLCFSSWRSQSFFTMHPVTVDRMGTPVLLFTRMMGMLYATAASGRCFGARLLYREKKWRIVFVLSYGHTKRKFILHQKELYQLTVNSGRHVVCLSWE